MNMKFKLLLIPLAIILIGLYSAAYVIDETEQVVITQFGKPIGEPKTDPGLYFKIPMIQHANYLPKNLLEWDGDAGQVPTRDKTFIWVDTFARWRIVDPLKFLQTVTNITGAMGRLDDIIDPAVRNYITSYPLIETVRWTNREMDTFELGSDQEENEQRFLGDVTMGREKIMEGIRTQAQPKLAQFGIELLDVQIKQLNYVEEVRKSVYGRMIAERKQMAEKFRSEGQGEARVIEGKQERELKRITSEAYKRAQEIKGKADATATKVYAEAYSEDPTFYSFLKTLELYEKSIGEKTSLVLSTDSQLTEYFKGYQVLRDQGPVKDPVSMRQSGPIDAEDKEAQYGAD